MTGKSLRIKAPDPRLSSRDKRTLKLIAEILLRVVPSASSRDEGEVVALSDAQATKLMGLLEGLLESRDFFERNHLIEFITGDYEKNEHRARELFYRQKKILGKSNPWINRQWAQFCTRYGLRDVRDLEPESERMPFSDFIKMEEKLAISLELHPRVVGLLLEMLRDVEGQVEEIRQGAGQIKAGAINRVVTQTIRQLKKQKVYPNNGPTLDRERLVGLWTSIANGSVMFTTRDWGVAGTISTVAGALLMGVLPKK